MIQKMVRYTRIVAYLEMVRGRRSELELVARRAPGTFITIV